MNRRTLLSSLAGFFFAPTVKPEPVLLVREVGDGVFEVYGSVTPEVTRALSGKRMKELRIYSAAGTVNLP